MRKVALHGTLAAGLATLANVAHGGSHAGQQVPLASWQWAYVVVVIFCAPIVAAALLWTRLRVAGAWLLFSSMAASLAFGLVFHFLIGGPDNAFSRHHGPGHVGFAATAVLVALSQAVGAGTGAWAVSQLSRRRAEASVGATAVAPGGPR